MQQLLSVLTAIVAVFGIVFVTLGAWIQHFITSINEEIWVVLVIGVLFPPVGILHGWLVWLGVV